MPSDLAPPDALIDAFVQQASWCDRLGSPFTAALLRWLAGELPAGGALRELLPAWPGDPVVDVVPLRVAGALHALVLTGAEADLAGAYPPCTMQFDAQRLAPLLRSVLRRQRGHFEQWLRHAPQTNEVRRSAVLLGGYNEIARHTRLPLALREIGASAGLNLLWDRFRYTLGAQHYGPLDSPVKIDCDWRGDAVPAMTNIEVASRAGCDIAPIDVTDPSQATRLAAYVWADQRERLQRLQAAMKLAAAHPPRLDASDAANWVEREFAAPVTGVAMVLCHSIVWQYLPRETRTRIRRHLDRVAAQATRAAPIAWLRLEHLRANEPPWISLTVWPSGQEDRLAQAHPHGEWVQWQRR